MPIKLDRLVIFGDSMSDIGNKRETGMGQVARALGMMRTNEAGRFSDRKNWTDFIWEWAGGATMFETGAERTRELTLHHRSLNKMSRYGTPPSAGFSYINYAAGGAMGASDRSATGLGTFKDQVDKYLEEMPAFRTSGDVLHIVWFGLNDLVTNGRDKTKMKQVAVEMCDLCEQILTKQRQNSYFIFANIPNPQGAVRFMGKEETELVRGYQTGAFEFGYELARQASIFPDNRATLLDLYTPIEHINEHLDAYGLKKGAQPTGVKVRYSKMESFDNNSFFTTTSDEAHPTEAVYRLIGQIWAGEILARFDLGELRNEADARFVIK